nr:unnamed protein product [Callosobruchus analis]
MKDIKFLIFRLFSRIENTFQYFCSGECVDMRKDLCYLNYSRWRCTTPMTQNQTKKVCCCSMGQAWGQPCEPCPLAGTSRYTIACYYYHSSPLSPHDYIGLCGARPGQIVNPITNETVEIDECELMPSMCKHGQCVNTPGSFECMCRSGYVYDENSHQCIDDNECLRNPCGGAAQCGYKHGYTMMDCVDINECVDKPGICQNGECKNLEGSFQCICESGFKLTSTRDNCIDIDECVRHPNICNNGSCINIVGSYKVNKEFAPDL